MVNVVAALSYDTMMSPRWQRGPDWKTLKLRCRYTLGAVLFTLGMLCIVFTFIPSGTASQDGDRRQWTLAEQALWPFINLAYINPPPL